MSENHKLSNRSMNNMVGCHQDLIKLVRLALSYSKYDFGITPSVRTRDEQERLLAKGEATTTTMNSRHIPSNNECKMSCAVDFVVYVNGAVTWNIKYYRKVIQAFFRAAIELGIQIEAGGLWEKPVDGPHIQLAWRDYP